MRNFDLHMHSAYSNDGEFTPSQLIEMAAGKDMEAVALSDHDCMLGIDEMIEAGKKAGIKVVPAIEFSTLFEGEFECHLLGYGFDYKQDYFQNLHTYVKQLMNDAFHTRVEKLENYYSIKIDEKKILEDSKGENPWYLMCQRMFQDPANAHIEDFKEYRPGGKRSQPAPVNFFWDKCQKGSPLYVYVKFPAFRETVKRIHDAGGIAVLAHPFNNFYQREDMLKLAIESGIDGIEAFSNYHDAKQNAYYERYAKEHGLLITCGSDFHGKLKPTIEMGKYGADVPDKDKILEEFLKAAKCQ